MDTLTLQERQELLKEYRKKEKTCTTWYKSSISALAVFIIFTLLCNLFAYKAFYIIFMIAAILSFISLVAGIIFKIIAHNNAKFLERSIHELIIENELKRNPYFASGYNKK